MLLPQNAPPSKSSSLKTFLPPHIFLLPPTFFSSPSLFSSLKWGKPRKILPQNRLPPHQTKKRAYWIYKTWVHIRPGTCAPEHWSEHLIYKTWVHIIPGTCSPVHCSGHLIYKTWVHTIPSTCSPVHCSGHLIYKRPDSDSPINRMK